MASMMPGRKGRAQHVFESNEVCPRRVATFLSSHSCFLSFRQEKERWRDYSLARTSSRVDDRDASGTRNEMFHTLVEAMMCGRVLSKRSGKRARAEEVCCEKCVACFWRDATSS